MTCYFGCFRCRWLQTTIFTGYGRIGALPRKHCRADSRLAPSQWETSLQSNAVSHWLGANLQSALHCHSHRQNWLQLVAWRNTKRGISCMWPSCPTTMDHNWQRASSSRHLLNVVERRALPRIDWAFFELEVPSWGNHPPILNISANSCRRWVTVLCLKWHTFNMRNRKDWTTWNICTAKEFSSRNI